MTKRYTGGVVSSAVPTVNAATASGVFLLSQQADAQAKNNWPPFKVEKSLRFRAANSAYLSRTPAVAGNQQKWTWSAWIKKGYTSGDNVLFGCGTGGTGDTTWTYLTLADNFILNGYNQGWRVTSQVFRDPAAWYHLICAVDTTQSTANNRVKMYVNGVEITSFSTLNNPSQNSNLSINRAAQHTISSRQTYSNDGYFDGQMTEINFVDGQQLTPSSFGATDKDGNWSPIAYTGTYGQNGFYLNFKDATSTTTLGYDYSGNGNNWTPNNLSVTAGATYDSMIDVPEDQSDGTANNRGSYCTINPLLYNAGSISYTNGNMTATMTAAADRFTIGNICVSSGKFYWELTVSGLVQSNDFNAGICKQTQVANGPWVAAGGPNVILYNTNSGWNVYGATQGSANGTISNGDTIGVAMDLDANNLYIYKNGALFQTLSSYQSNAIDTTVPHTFFFDSYRSGSVVELNCGQRPFAYAPPSGFKTLNTYNLPEPTIKQPNKHFAVSTYTGTGAAQTINSGLDLSSGGLVWTKTRSNAVNHDIRSSGLLNNYSFLQTNTTSPENNTATQYATTFNSTGYSIDSYGDNINQNTYTFVSWQWKAGAVVTNTTGTITSQVRANPTAGFSIVTYTGTLSAAGTATVGHGLSVAPSMIIFKARNADTSWPVQHISLAANNTLNLSGTNLSLDQTSNGNLPKPTASVFYTNWTTGMNINGNTQVAYCFAPIAGYSAFGSYVGNGSTDGPFVYTGFRPKFVMIKATSTGGAGYDWFIHDTARDTYNVCTLDLEANLSLSENQYGAEQDIVSNGFKLRNTGGGTNQSGVTYIYMAFAEAPFKYSRSR